MATENEGTEENEGAEGTTPEGAQGEGQEQDDGDWTPPTKQDWENVQLALKKARQDARQAKREAKAGTSAEGGSTEAPDVDKAVKEATTATEARYKPMVVKAAARAAFAEAGLVMPKGNGDAAMGRVIRLLDLDDLDIDDDGQVSGLVEQIDDIKADFPELFASTRRPARVDGADKPAGSAKPQSSADALAAMISGGR